MVCRCALYCQIKGKIIEVSNDIPTNEKTNNGGNQGIFPPLPSINNKAVSMSPAMKHVPNFLKSDFEAIVFLIRRLKI